MKIKFSFVSPKDHKCFKMKAGESIDLHSHDEFDKPMTLPEIRIRTHKKHIFSPLSIELMVHPAKMLGSEGLEWGSAIRTIK